VQLSKELAFNAYLVDEGIPMEKLPVAYALMDVGV